MYANTPLIKIGKKWLQSFKSYWGIKVTGEKLLEGIMELQSTYVI